MAQIGTILAALLAACGWIVFVVGFGKMSTADGVYYTGDQSIEIHINNQTLVFDNMPSKTSAYYFCWWALAVGGLLVNLLFLAKAFSKSKVVGFLHSLFFAAFTILACGAIVNANGQVLWKCDQDSHSLKECVDSIPTFIKLQFAGSLVYVFMMAVSMGGLYFNALQGDEAYA